MPRVMSSTADDSDNNDDNNETAVVRMMVMTMISTVSLVFQALRIKGRLLCERAHGRASARDLCFRTYHRYRHGLW